MVLTCCLSYRFCIRIQARRQPMFVGGLNAGCSVLRFGVSLPENFLTHTKVERLTPRKSNTLNNKFQVSEAIKPQTTTVLFGEKWSWVGSAKEGTRITSVELLELGGSLKNPQNPLNYGSEFVAVAVTRRCCFVKGSEHSDVSEKRQCWRRFHWCPSRWRIHAAGICTIA